jgi:F-type H+-transporting ATPase subunit gamma
MANLKDLRDRIGSVKSTKKITSAMKMVAASKLRKSQKKAEASQPYARLMTIMLARVLESLNVEEEFEDTGVADAVEEVDGIDKDKVQFELLEGRDEVSTHRLVVFGSDRGLCGAFNANIIRRAAERIDELLEDGKQVEVICVGSKIRDGLQRDYGDYILDTIEDIGKPEISFDKAKDLSDRLLDAFDGHDFDKCEMIYARFKSALKQIPTQEPIIPFEAPKDLIERIRAEQESAPEDVIVPHGVYDFEPSEEDILAELLPRYVATQIYRVMLDSAAGEMASRMTAMDSATNNAEDMIDDLTKTFNRERQAAITNELMEIIAGASAV